MPEVVLAGCAPEPLMGYLKGLGVFRLVAQQADPAARVSWRGGVGRLQTTLERAALIEFFVDRYRPTPVVSPWNGGSGFYRTWDDKTKRFRSRQAVERVAFIKNSASARLTDYKDVVRQVEETLVAYATSINVETMPGKERKATLLIDERHGILESQQASLLPHLRATLPDATVEWLDAVVLLQAEDTRAAPLFISGGNDGNLDFSVTFMGCLEECTSGRQASRGRFVSSVFAEGLLPTEHGTAGHFNPSGLGGPNDGQGFAGSGSLNPWDFVLMVEGTLLLAGAVARRYGVDSSDRAAFPFCALPVAVGFGTAASADETSDGCRTELWLPLWSSYVGLAELHYLFAEGRAQLGRRQARNGVEFALAACLLGVSRGIDSFVRYAFLRRFGKMFLAAPLGQVPVTPRPAARLLDDQALTTWLDRLRSACRDKDKTPARYQSALRQIDRAIYEFATGAQVDPTADRRGLLEVLRAVGRAEQDLASGLAFCKEKNLRPLHGLSWQWLDQADDGSAEFRLAAAVAGVRAVQDTDVGPLRAHLEPVVRGKGGRFEWHLGSTSAVWSNRALDENLAASFLRRQLEAFRAGLPGVPLDTARPAPLADVLAFLASDTDDEKLHDLVWGLAVLAWPEDRVDPEPSAEPAVQCGFGIPRLLVRPLALTARAGGWRLGGSETIVPDPTVFQGLRSGQPGAVARCVDQAARRLKAGGRLVVGYRNRYREDRSLGIATGFAPGRLLAACLFPLCDSDLELVANAVLYPPQTEE
jgi:CRISPR-associated protein Csx17